MLSYCCQYSGLKPGGGFRAFHRVLVYLRAASGTEPSVAPRSGWSPLTDRCVLGTYEKTAVAPKCLLTHSAVVQSFTSDTARAVAVYRSSGHAISQLLSWNKSVVSAHAQVARSGRKRRSPNLYGRCTHLLFEHFDTAQAIHPFL